MWLFKKKKDEAQQLIEDAVKEDKEREKEEKKIQIKKQKENAEKVKKEKSEKKDKIKQVEQSQQMSEFELSPEELQSLRRCPKCNSKLRKSKVIKQKDIFSTYSTQVFKCRNLMCDFYKEVKIKV